MLNDDSKYEILNLGLSGRTMQKNGDVPYWDEDGYQEALNSEPDILIL